MSLGGVRDEAEVRGHRRTYIGSMPGKILQSMSKVGVKNPLFLLDEVDKLGQDWRGDPSSALLEVLDPEQNNTFTDHYIEVEYDLSEVMFIATANTLNIPAPLLDRMEVIRLSGYTEDEKVSIAMQYLLPKQMKNNGLKEGEVSVTEPAIRDIVRYYTREAGVRSLEREISKVCRKAVKQLLTEKQANEGKPKRITVMPRNLDKFLGVRKFSFGMAEKKNQVGQVTGLAWTEVGGELLTIETVTMPGKGKTITTGKLGEVMQESIQAALSVVRNRSRKLGVQEDFYQKNDMHIHLPEGATPKDGPSAGIGIATAMVSVLTGIPVRADVAMTGEITLRGEVLAIGGLKEKLLAAHRGGIKTVMIPDENVKDLVEIPGQRQEQARDHPGEMDRQGAGDRSRARAGAAARGGRCRGAAARRGEARRARRRQALSSAMNKADMIEQIAQAAEVSKSAAERAVDALVGAVKSTLKKGEHGHAGRLRHLLRQQARGPRRAQSAHRRGAHHQGDPRAALSCWQSPQGCNKLAPLLSSTAPARRRTTLVS